MWQELIETLNELNKTYRALIALSEKKHKALIVIDLKSIDNNNLVFILRNESFFYF